MRVVVDSNVIIDALLPNEYIEAHKKERAKKSKNFLEAALKGKHEMVIPAIGLIEVCARLSKIMREKFDLNILKFITENAAIIYQDKDFIDNLMPEIAKIDYKGCDAVFSAVASFLNLKLLTSDEELYKYLDKEHERLGIDVLLLEKMPDPQIEGAEK
jgi:predicted nucleic acid-binding protein